MTDSESRSKLEIVATELRALGLTIQRLPGEYAVNFRDGRDDTARFADDLDQALEIGRAMAAERATDPAVAAKKPPRRRWRRKRMTPKARRRRFILGHNRRVRARAIRKPGGKR